MVNVFLIVRLDDIFQILWKVHQAGSDLQKTFQYCQIQPVFKTKIFHEKVFGESG